MKKFLLILATVVLAALMLVCGCNFTDGRDGRDGKDGQNVTIEDIYGKYVEEYGDISYADFLKEYLNYTNTELDGLTGVRSKINKSLMCGVTILTRFAYSNRQSGTHLLPGSSYTTYSVYTGSGAILWLDKEAGDAYVVTNCHVVYSDTSDSKFCNDVRLYLYGQDENGINYTIYQNSVRGYDSYDIKNDDNYRIDAEIVGASVTYDIALLKVTGSEVIKRSNLSNDDVAVFSSSEDVFVGEAVYAIGNASGEGMSATYGIISKDSEYIELALTDEEYVTEDDYVSYRVMRTTAPINHGNSGGALYNTNGEIVGIINAKDESEDIDNMGYALPGNSVRRLVKLMYDNYVSNGNKMLSGGGVVKAYLNIETAVTDSYASFNEETGLAEITELVMVNSTLGNPAYGKLQTGDFIKAVKILDSEGTEKDKVTVTRRYHVPDVLFSVRKGDKVIMTIERNGTEMDVTIDFNSDNYFKSFK